MGSRMDLGMKIDPSMALMEMGTKADANKGESVEKTAEQFESFFIFSMLKEFGKAMGVTKKSYAEDAEMSIFYEKVGDLLAKKGIGIKEMIVRYAERGAKVSDMNGEKSK
jgi:Rod binding domain-containing protein